MVHELNGSNVSELKASLFQSCAVAFALTIAIVITILIAVVVDPFADNINEMYLCNDPILNIIMNNNRLPNDISLKYLAQYGFCGMYTHDACCVKICLR